LAPISTRDLRRACGLIIRNLKILGGQPVFRGTRVPVHMIAELLAQGSTADELFEAYPRLTTEMIRLSQIYATAYPLRRRPPHQPWRNQKPVRQARRRIAAISA
jgi:uncharacterized protein (DUF433 family)